MSFARPSRIRTTAPSACAAALVLGCGLLGCRASEEPGDSPDSETAFALPNVDVSAAHPLVIEQVNAAREAAIESPNSATALGYLGRVYHAHEYFEAAMTCYQRAAELAPLEFRWQYLLGRAAAVRGRREQALTALQRASRMRPDYVPVWLHLGNLYRAVNDLDRAVTCYQRALEVDPDSMRAHYGLGMIEADRGNPEGAAAHLERALAAKPDFPKTRYALAMVYRDLGRVKEAQVQLELYRSGSGQAGPPKPQAPEARSEVTPFGDPLMMKLARLRISPNQLLARADRLAKEGRYREAVSLYRRVVKLMPDFGGARFQLGNALWGLGQTSRAIEAYREGLVRNPNNAPARNNLGTMCLATGLADQAVLEFREALRIKPDLVEPRLRLADELLGKTRCRDAFELLHEGLELSPNAQELGLSLAWLLATARDDGVRNGEEAVRLAERYCRRGGLTEVRDLEVLAAAYAEAGRFGQAIAAARRAINLAGDLPLGDRRKAVLTANVTRGITLYEAGKPYRSSALPGF